MSNDVYVVVLDNVVTTVLCVFSKYEDAENYILTKWTDHIEYGSNKVLLPTELEFRVLDIANKGVATMTDHVYYIKRREFNP